MKIFIGTDHNGYNLRDDLVRHLKQAGHEVIDDGDSNIDSNDDFPIFAGKVAANLLASDDPDARGILICGSGQGMCMAANRFKGIRAALLYDRESAKSSRNDDDSNVACLPSRALENKKALEIIDIWLSTPFAAASRFMRRIKEMDEL
ncbi:RpiB/LacA/LacB family sugar-phosphate isomerase [Candidatus Saccharibacteria bacterium]|nr:RpiB/LacA/LacB family sugar-phosphate isomerase [Candidatus Saccharibacteria bacterium]MBI3338077.1 RpiB/LacA/LacB family sugar-phosphate isomerase [Candidatus Saccharibacteria bacterium]